MLESLVVGAPRGYESMTAKQCALHNWLRAHAHRIGDKRDARTGEQDTARLAHECACEQWCRMLFARFLAEAGLLVEPGSGMLVTLDEGRELAGADGGD